MSYYAVNILFMWPVWTKLSLSQPSCDWLSLKQVLSEGGAHPPETVLGTYYLIAVVEKV